IHKTENQPDLPPHNKRHVAAAEQDWRGRRAEVRQTGEETAEVRKYERREQRWRAQPDRDSEERSIHRADMRGEACEEVMRIKVRQAESKQARNPADAAEYRRHLVTEPFDQA